jgi:hypothetical protein
VEIKALSAYLLCCYLKLLLLLLCYCCKLINSQWVIIMWPSDLSFCSRTARACHIFLLGNKPASEPGVAAQHLKMYFPHRELHVLSIEIFVAS